MGRYDELFSYVAEESEKALKKRGVKRESSLDPTKMNVAAIDPKDPASPRALNPFPDLGGKLGGSRAPQGLERAIDAIGGTLTPRTSAQAKQPRQQYLEQARAGALPSFTFDANPERRKKQIAEIQALNTLLDEYQQRRVEPVNTVGVAGQRELLQNNNRPQTYAGTLALNAPQTYTPGMVDALMHPDAVARDFTRRGVQLTPAQQAALGPLMAARRLADANTRPLMNAAAAEMGGYAAGGAIGGAIAGPGTSALKNVLGAIAVRSAPRTANAVGGAIANAAARPGLTGGALRAAGRILNPARIAGNVAGNVVQQFATDYSDPLIPENERAGRLLDAANSGALGGELFNIGTEVLGRAGGAVLAPVSQALAPINQAAARGVTSAAGALGQLGQRGLSAGADALQAGAGRIGQAGRAIGQNLQDALDNPPDVLGALGRAIQLRRLQADLRNGLITPDEAQAEFGRLFPERVEHDLTQILPVTGIDPLTSSSQRPRVDASGPPIESHFEVGDPAAYANWRARFTNTDTPQLSPRGRPTSADLQASGDIGRPPLRPMFKPPATDPYMTEGSPTQPIEPGLLSPAPRVTRAPRTRRMPADEFTAAPNDQTMVGDPTRPIPRPEEPTRPSAAPEAPPVLEPAPSLPRRTRAAGGYRDEIGTVLEQPAPPAATPGTPPATPDQTPKLGQPPRVEDPAPPRPRIKPAADDADSPQVPRIVPKSLTNEDFKTIRKDIGIQQRAEDMARVAELEKSDKDAAYALEEELTYTYNERVNRKVAAVVRERDPNFSPPGNREDWDNDSLQAREDVIRALVQHDRQEIRRVKGSLNDDSLSLTGLRADSRFNRVRAFMQVPKTPENRDLLTNVAKRFLEAEDAERVKWFRKNHPRQAEGVAETLAGSRDERARRMIAAIYKDPEAPVRAAGKTPPSADDPSAPVDQEALQNVLERLKREDEAKVAGLRNTSPRTADAVAESLANSRLSRAKAQVRAEAERVARGKQADAQRDVDDAIDRSILDHLAESPTASLQEIAKAANTAVVTVQARLKELQRKGVLRQNGERWEFVTKEKAKAGVRDYLASLADDATAIVDDIVTATGLPANKVNVELGMMELNGDAVRGAGGQWKLSPEARKKGAAPSEGTPPASEKGEAPGKGEPPGTSPKPRADDDVQDNVLAHIGRYFSQDPTTPLPQDNIALLMPNDNAEQVHNAIAALVKSNWITLNADGDIVRFKHRDHRWSEVKNPAPRRPSRGKTPDGTQIEFRVWQIVDEHFQRSTRDKPISAQLIQDSMEGANANEIQAILKEFADDGKFELDANGDVVAYEDYYGNRVGVRQRPFSPKTETGSSPNPDGTAPGEDGAQKLTPRPRGPLTGISRPTPSQSPNSQNLTPGPSPAKNRQQGRADQGSSPSSPRPRIRPTAHGKIPKPGRPEAEGSWLQEIEIDGNNENIGTFMGRTGVVERDQDGRVVGFVTTMEPSEIGIDPQAFQFRSGVGKNGVTNKMAGQPEWSPADADPLWLWYWPEKGKSYVVNGHHRLDFALKKGARTVKVTWIDAATPEEARLVGALRNMKDGTADAWDAARVLRSTGITFEELKAAGIAIKGSTARIAADLARANDQIWDRVARGALTPERAAALAGSVNTHGEQTALLGLVEELEKRRGRQLSPAEIAEVANQHIKNGDTSLIAGSGAGQLTLGGEDDGFVATEAEKALALDQLDLSTWLQSELSKLRNEFKRLQSQDRALLIDERGVGNINTDAARAIVAEADAMLGVYKRLSSMGGPINKALRSAARDKASGVPLDQVKRKLYEDTKQAIIEELGAAAETAGLRPSSAGARQGPRGVSEPASGGNPPGPAGGAAAGPEAGPEGRVAPEIPAQRDLFADDDELQSVARPGRPIPAQPNSGRTQRGNTVPSYGKAAIIAKEAHEQGDLGDVLDYGAGLGLGSDELRKSAQSVSTYEPNGERWASDTPRTYASSSEIDRKFDTVISLNVLNVVEKDTRDQIVRHIGDLLEDGGVAVIGARSWTGGIATQTKFQAADEAKALLARQPDGSYTFQKGFDGPELRDYVAETLGPRFTVERVTRNSAGDTSVVVRKGMESGNLFGPDADLPRMSQTAGDQYAELFRTAGRTPKSWTDPLSMAPVDPIPDGGPVLPWRAAQDRLAGKLKATLRHAPARLATVLGRYQPASGLIATSRAHDPITMGHEVGHWLDHDGGLSKEVGPSDPAMMNLGEIISGVNYYADPDKNSAEAVAEWHAIWLVNPDAARTMFPRFTAHWEATIPKPIQAHLREFGDNLRRAAALSPLERARLNIRMSSDRPRKAMRNAVAEITMADAKHPDEPFRTTWRTMLTAAIVDDLAPFAAAWKYATSGKAVQSSNDAVGLLRLFGNVNAKAQEAINTGMIMPDGRLRPDTKGGFLNYLIKGQYQGDYRVRARRTQLMSPDTSPLAAGDPWHRRRAARAATGLPLQEARRQSLGGAEAAGFRTDKREHLEQDMADAVQYMVAQRDLFETTNRGARKKEQVSGKTYFRPARKGKFTGDAMAIRSGADPLSSDRTSALARIKELRADPIRLARAREGAKRYRTWSNSLLDYAERSGRLSRQQVLQYRAENPLYVDWHRVVGETGLEPPVGGNPQVAKISSGAQIVHQMVGSTRTLNDPYANLMRATDLVIKESDRNRVLLAFSSALRDVPGGTPLNLASVGYRLQVPSPDGNDVKIYRGGKLELWRFEPGIQKALQRWGANLDAGNPFSRFLQAAARFRRAGIVYSPGFAVRNIIKDLAQRLVQTTAGNNPLEAVKYLARAMAPTGAGAEFRAQLRRQGGGGGGHYLRTQDDYRAAMRKAIIDASEDERLIVLHPGRLLDAYKNLLESSEHIGRTAEYLRMVDKLRKAGASETNARFGAAEASVNLIDYNTAGTIGRWVNSYVPFTSANIAGTRAMVEGFRRDPAGTAARWLVYVGLPTVAMYSAVSQDEETLREYRQFPTYLRDLFALQRLGPNKWIAVPKPYQYAAMSAALERYLDHENGNAHAYDNLPRELIRTLQPVDESTLGPAAMQPLVEIATNRDVFRDRQIVPETEARLDVRLRDTSHASTVGQWLQSIAGVDARHVDHLVSGIGGPVASLGMTGVDAATGRWDRDPAGRAVGLATGLTRRTPGPEAVDVQASEELLARTGRANSRPAMRLRGLRQKYYRAQDAQGREDAARRLQIAGSAIRAKLSSPRAEQATERKIIRARRKHEQR